MQAGGWHVNFQTGVVHECLFSLGASHFKPQLLHIVFSAFISAPCVDGAQNQYTHCRLCEVAA
jgi:hypothetical protein